MKKKVFGFVFLILAIIAEISCSRSGPSVPAKPTATSAGTVTVTLTATVTMTATVTTTATVSATVTVTATVTETPTTMPTLFFDDFEDGDLNNSYGAWEMDTHYGSVVSSWGVVPAPPGNGAYAMELTFTALAETANYYHEYYGYIDLYSYISPTLNLSGYSGLTFSYSFKGKINGNATAQIQILLSDVNQDYIYYNLDGFSPGFNEYTIPFSDFNINIVGHDNSYILSDVKNLSIWAVILGDQNATLNGELKIDDIKFTDW